jgi:tetratricopeptide (TPR) repeat protein
MESINELEIQKLLRRKKKPAEVLRYAIDYIIDPKKTWEEKRAMYLFLYRWGKNSTLAHAMMDALASKERVPFDILIEVTAASGIRPGKTAVEAILKGLRKQNATEEVLSATGWDQHDERFNLIRRERLDKRVGEAKAAKESMLDKFNFLKGQRLVEQAGRVLRRMLELYPDDKEFIKIKQDFDEQWAREVVSGHMATLTHQRLERNDNENSASDEQMLKEFLAGGEKLALDRRELAADLAIAFLFMNEKVPALEILHWAPVSAANDWLRAELLVDARHHVEALEHLNDLEVKYASDPETTFAVSYLRARCFKELGQKDAALEILQSIVRIRPNYRSAQALFLEWSEGVDWG